MDLTEKIGKVAIQVRQNLALFSCLISLTLSWKCVKNLILTKIVLQIKFEGEWGKLEAENCFQRESWTKYMKQTLVLIRNNTLRESFDFFSANIKKCFE